MKKIYLILFLITIMLSCRDEDAVRVPEFQNAPNVRIQMRAGLDFFDLSKLNTGTTKLVYDVYSENSGEIEEVELSFRYQKAGNAACNLGGCLGPFVIKTYTGAEVESATAEEITMTDLLNLLGLSEGDIGGGDQFLFVNKTTMKDGRVYPTVNPTTGQDNVPVIYDTPGASWTGSFAAIVGCPFVIADLVGKYDIVNDAFGVAVDGHTEVDVIAGPGANQYTAKNIFGHGFDFVATVNPASGATTATAQQTWDPFYFALPITYRPGNAASVATNGSTTFSCVGQINLNLTYTVSAGSYGNFKFTMLKQQ